MVYCPWGCKELDTSEHSLTHTESEIARSCDSLIINIWEIFILFFIVVILIYVFTNSAQEFPFSTALPKLTVFCIFYNIHSNRYQMVSHCGFDLYFPDESWCRASYHVFYWWGLSVLQKCLFNSFPIFKIKAWLIYIGFRYNIVNL